MTYATRDDLSARYGAAEIEDLAPAGAVPDRAATALADAAAEIDGRLAPVYSLPLPQPGRYPALKRIACAIARRHLYDEAPTDAVRDGARRARDELGRIASDRAAIVSETGAMPPKRARAQATAPEPQLSRETLADA